MLPRAGSAVMLLSLLLQSLFPKGVCAITSALQKGMGASSNQGYAARVGVGCGVLVKVPLVFGAPGECFTDSLGLLHLCLEDVWPPVCNTAGPS